MNLLLRFLPTEPKAQHTFNLWMAWLWFLFGILGCLDYVFGFGIGLAESIPVLFGISVYANFVGHISAAQAARAEDNISSSTPDSQDTS